MDQASSSSNVKDHVGVDDNEEREALEIPLFQVPECYVYLVKVLTFIRLQRDGYFEISNLD